MGSQTSIPLPPHLVGAITESMTIRDTARVSQVSKRGLLGAYDRLTSRIDQFKDDVETKFYMDIVDRYMDPRLFEIIFDRYETGEYPIVGVYDQYLPQNIMLIAYVNESIKYDLHHNAILTKVVELGVHERPDFIRQYARILSKYLDLQDVLTDDSSIDKDGKVDILDGVIYLLADLHNKDKKGLNTDLNDNPIVLKDILSEITNKLNPRCAMLLLFASGESVCAESMLIPLESTSLLSTFVCFSEFILFGNNINTLKTVLLVFLECTARRDEFITAALTSLFRIILPSPYNPHHGIYNEDYKLHLPSLFEMLTSHGIDAGDVLRQNSDTIFSNNFASALLLSKLYYDDAMEITNVSRYPTIQESDDIELMFYLSKSYSTFEFQKRISETGGPVDELLDVEMAYHALFEGRDVDKIQEYLGKMRTFLKIDYSLSFNGLIPGLSTVALLLGHYDMDLNRYSTTLRLPNEGFENIFKLCRLEDIDPVIVSSLCSNVHQLMIMESYGLAFDYGDMLVERACVCADIQMLNHILRHDRYIRVDDEAIARITSLDIPIAFIHLISGDQIS
jgi:hypothetical protein